MEGLKVIFLGTPDFAVASLKSIHESNHTVLAVVTMPDKPAGRGHKLQASPVKKIATENNLPVLQPANLKDKDFIKELSSYNADIFVVVAFRMLPEVVWNMPPLGTVNLHGSLLPNYRGAAPINWAIMNGDDKTGVTTFQLKHKIDTGNILLRAETNISKEDNVGTVHDRLMSIGSELIVETLDKLQEGKITPIDQESLIESSFKEAPKLFKNDCLINWRNNTVNIHNQIRGLSPYPCAFTKLVNNKTNEVINLKIYKSEKSNKKITSGEISVEGKQVFIGTMDGAIELIDVHLAGKKRMKITDLLNGFNLSDYKTNVL